MKRLLKNKYLKLSANLFIITNCFLLIFISYKWGIDFLAIAFFIVAIAVSRIFLDKRLVITIASSLTFAILGINALQINRIIERSDYWRSITWETPCLLLTLELLVTISMVVLAINRKLEWSLVKVKRSENELEEEKCISKTRLVAETKKMKKSQDEKIKNVYSLSEYGKLATGLFHDLSNPLTIISLNIEKIQNICKTNDELMIIKSEINMTRKALTKINNLLSLARRQSLYSQNINVVFSLNKEILDVIEILSYRTRKYKAQIRFANSKELYLRGNNVKFNQIASNIISNAIESYQPNHKNNVVDVCLKENHNNIDLIVTDYGKGIPKKIQNKIFGFFTTKELNIGNGVGLCITKKIIKSDFKGKITFSTEEGKGTTFVVSIPKNV
ncbi:MAG: HAMP domain-containing sensor histidine kinase [Candidatus Pacebacteria bacterium]|nr:HAMP domain-containing sensor histidine kinase [Candidatus Paceibacterota bacterium]